MINNSPVESCRKGEQQDTCKSLYVFCNAFDMIHKSQSHLSQWSSSAARCAKVLQTSAGLPSRTSSVKNSKGNIPNRQPKAMPEELPEYCGYDRIREEEKRFGPNKETERSVSFQACVCVRACKKERVFCFVELTAAILVTPISNCGLESFGSGIPIRWETSSIIPPKLRPTTSANTFPKAAAVMVPIPKATPMFISM